MAAVRVCLLGLEDPQIASDSTGNSSVYSETALSTTSSSLAMSNAAEFPGSNGRPSDQVHSSTCSTATAQNHNVYLWNFVGPVGEEFQPCVLSLPEGHERHWEKLASNQWWQQLSRLNADSKLLGVHSSIKVSIE